MLNLLRNNFGLKVLAVCLAVAAWGYFHLAAAPGTTARFDESIAVPIVVTGLRPGYQANYGTRTATVVVEAPRNGPDLRPDQFRSRARRRAIWSIPAITTSTVSRGLARTCRSSRSRRVRRR